MKKWLKRFALFLGAVVLLALAALAIYVYRAHPTLSGQAKLAGLGSEVSIQRDASDVTHIEGKTSLDTWRAIGWVHAQERSWQLEFNRRLMHGELSEILGSATLETDKLMRTLGIIQAAKAQLANYPPEVRAALEAYAAGINGFHAASPQALPPEFHILGAKPGAWMAADSVGWGLMMALDLGGNWGAEFARLSSLQKLSTQQLWQMMPPYPGEQPASKVDFAKLYQDLGVFASEPTKSASTTSTPKLFGGLSASLGAQINDWATSLGHIDSRGSNNWVVAGHKTQSGKPLLANDPHLALGAPAVWYFARLKSPDFDTIGATLPGMPFVILGRTASAAWGFTNTGPDTQDLYLEQIDAGNPKQYRTPNGFAAFTERLEPIKVKGLKEGGGVVHHIVRTTRHGPVVSDAQSVYNAVLNKSKFAVALRWAALDADNLSLVAAYHTSRATTVAELRHAYKDHHSPMQNIVMADTSGQILYKAAGKVPLRHPQDNIKGVAPALGWDSRYDWTGWLAYDKTPETTHNSITVRGWHATANERIHAPEYPHFIGADWAVPYRYERISTLLRATPVHSVDSMKAIQFDHVSLAAKVVLPALLTVQSDHPMAAAVMAQLKAYDGKMSLNSTSASVVNAWVDELTRSLLGDQLGAEKLKTLYGKRQFRQGLEEMLLANQGKGHKDWCAPQTCAERYTAAFDATLNRLGHDYGKDISLWTWGRLHPALSSHRPFSSVPVLKNYFTVSVPSVGDPYTVNVGQYHLQEAHMPFANRHAASLRAIYDLADLERTEFVYQTGQSGLVFSSRYRDMQSQWADGSYRKLQINTTNFRSNLKLIP